MGHIRKMISNHMIKSRNTSVHVYSTSEVDMTNIVQFRNDKKEEFSSIIENNSGDINALFSKLKEFSEQ